MSWADVNTFLSIAIPIKWVLIALVLYLLFRLAHKKV